jgi:hypothetical protein
MKPLKLIQ